MVFLSRHSGFTLALLLLIVNIHLEPVSCGFSEVLGRHIGACLSLFLSGRAAVLMGVREAEIHMHARPARLCEQKVRTGLISTERVSDTTLCPSGKSTYHFFFITIYLSIINIVCFLLKCRRYI